MKTKRILIFLGILGLGGIVSLSIAGNLQPASGPTGSVMRTLHEIYQAITRSPGHTFAVEGRWTAAMAIHDIPGPWDLPWQDDAFKVIDVRHSLSMQTDPKTGAPNGAEPGEILILRDMDEGSPLFLEQAHLQQPLSDVVLYFFQRPGSLAYEDVYLKLTMTNVMVVRHGQKVVHRKDGQFAHLEEIRLLPTTMTAEYLTK